MKQKFNGRKWISFFFFAMLGFYGCQSDHNQSDDSKALNGIWVSEGYGRILWIRNGEATTYDISGAGCIQRSAFFDVAGNDVTRWTIELNDRGDQFLYHANATVNTYSFVKIDALPGVCDAGGLQTDDALENFDYLWTLFNEHYAFFEERNVDWSALKNEYRSQVNDDNLWEVATGMLSILSDDHVTIADNAGNEFKAGQQMLYARFYEEYMEAGEPGGDFTAYIQSEYGKILTNINHAYLVSGFRTSANGKVSWGKLDDNIGYLQILEMNGFTAPYQFDQQVSTIRSVMNDVISDLSVCKKIVIDVRFNSGGLDRVSLEIAGRFSKQAIPVWKIRARNGQELTEPQSIMLQPTGATQMQEIVVLTSNFTASAAETFTLAMKELPNVTLIGENTNGIFSTMLSKTLPNGWNVTLSNEYWTDQGNISYEVTGITPDIAAPFPSRADRDNENDPVLEKALDFLK